MIDSWFHNIYNTVSNTVRDVYSNAKNIIKATAQKVSDISGVIGSVVEGTIPILKDSPLLRDIAYGTKSLLGEIGKVSSAIGSI
jgi:phage-related protein